MNLPPVKGLMMGRIRKAYYTLDELVEIWRFPDADLRYVVENDLLGLSVRLVGPWMEVGEYDSVDEGVWVAVPLEQRRYDGLVDLHKRDAIALLRDGRVEAARFCHTAERLCGAPARRGERGHQAGRHADPLRGATPLRSGGAALPGGARRSPYRVRKLCLSRPELSLHGHPGPVLASLHEAAQAGCAWQRGKVALTAAGSNSLKMGDLFKRRPEWRDIVEHDGRGSYRSGRRSRAPAGSLTPPSSCAHIRSVFARRFGGLLDSRRDAVRRFPPVVRGRRNGRRRGDRGRRVSPPGPPPLIMREKRNRHLSPTCPPTSYPVLLHSLLGTTRGATDAAEALPEPEGAGPALGDLPPDAGTLALHRPGSGLLKLGGRVLYRLADIEAFEQSQLQRALKISHTVARAGHAPRRLTADPARAARAC